MSLGKNLAKLAIPLILLTGCSTTIYEGRIGKEGIRFMNKFGVRGYSNLLEITKNSQRGLMSQDLIQYFDWDEDGKIDEICISQGFGNVSYLKRNGETKKIFEIGQKEYDKYTKIKIPEARSNEINEIIKTITN
jgi:hypothetical protein